MFAAVVWALKVTEYPSFMTAGVALASWRDPHPPLLVVASDTRVSRNGLVVSDSSVKTLEVTSQIAAVFSGPATPGFVAAEMVRTIVRTHRRKPGSPALGFFDIARLFAHFQSEVGGNETDLGETLVVGYFRSGAPGLARILVGQGEARVGYMKCESSATLAMAIGPAEAKRVLLRGLEVARREGKKPVMASAELLTYLIRHEGFPGIGGQVSIGGCMSPTEEFKWPAIEIEGRRQWRGVDVTRSWPESWQEPVTIPYDEVWCSRVDERSFALPDPDDGSSRGGDVLTLDIVDLPKADLFGIHPDPPGF